jgi:NitT/TauT family transport system substrate-binding protein
VLDVRRGDGPKGCFDYTMSAIAARQHLVETQPEVAAAAVRAMVKTQQALRTDPGRATAVGRKYFPPEEAELIAELVRRDAPHYDAAITPQFVDAMQQFCRDIGILEGHMRYEQVVATQFAPLWRG